MFWKLVRLCLVIVLGLASIACAGEYLIGRWEKSGSNDGWTTCQGWGYFGNTVLTPGVTMGVTSGRGALKVENDLGWCWGIKVYVNPAQLQKYDVFKLDITRLADDWTLSGDPDCWNGLNFRVQGQSVSLQDLGDGNSWWVPSCGDGSITAAWDYSAYKDLFPKNPLWVEFVIAFNNSGYTGHGGRGILYLDNARLASRPPEMSITKCTIKAGKTPYAEPGQDADYVNRMKDYFNISGTIPDFDDLNDIDKIIVNLISGEGETVYTEEIDPNGYLDIAGGRFRYLYKIPRGEQGAITSLKIDFNRNTFSIKAKNLDLTGLDCPVTLELAIGSIIISTVADETVVNGANKLIPIRLMRTYLDTLRIKSAKAKTSVTPLTESFTVKGEIAVQNVADVNLVVEDVTLTWGDQTYSIPAGSFVRSSTARKAYKCSNYSLAEGGIANVRFDLDKCTFSAAVKNASLDPTTGSVDFAISFESCYNETKTLTLP